MPRQSHKPRKNRQANAFNRLKDSVIQNKWSASAKLLFLSLIVYTFFTAPFSGKGNGQEPVGPDGLRAQDIVTVPEFHKPGFNVIRNGEKIAPQGRHVLTLPGGKTSSLDLR
jgi:hypothetical protein